MFIDMNRKPIYTKLYIAYKDSLSGEPPLLGMSRSWAQLVGVTKIWPPDWPISATFLSQVDVRRRIGPRNGPCCAPQQEYGVRLAIF